MLSHSGVARRLKVGILIIAAVSRRLTIRGVPLEELVEVLLVLGLDHPNRDGDVSQG